MYTLEKAVNIYIFYELAGSSSHSDDPTLKIVYLVQLDIPKAQISISIGILVMELVLIEKAVFHFQVVDLVKMQ